MVWGRVETTLELKINREGPGYKIVYSIKLYRESLDILKKIGDTAGVAISLGQLGRIHEEKGNYKEAMEHYIIVLSIFIKIGSPDAEIVIDCLKRLRKIIGKEQFNKYWKEITHQKAPDFGEHQSTPPHQPL
jgi:tetratricopeptide (TPR) repeat protein